MKENLIKLSEEEMRSLLPEIQEDKELIGYEVTEESGNRIMAAIFFASAMNPTEGTLGYFYSDLPEEQGKLIERFFASCEKDLKKKGLQTLYYKKVGTYEELDRDHEILVQAGYEALVLMGDYQTCRIADLGTMGLVTEQASEPDGSELSAMNTPLSERQLALWDQLMGQNTVIQYANYTPEVSFLFALDENTGGMLCMNDGPDLLMTTALCIQAKDASTHDQILETLLRAMLRTAVQFLPPEKAVWLYFEDKHDAALVEKLLENRSETVHFQEFYKEL